MNKLYTVTGAAAVLLCLLLLPPARAQGQGVGVYGGVQRRRVGRVTLPTPPFNPHAGILGGRRRRGPDSPEVARRGAARRGVKATKRNAATKAPRKRVSKRR